jgi:hypothetical protein
MPGRPPAVLEQVSVVQLDGAVAFASAVAPAALDFQSRIWADAGLSVQVGPVTDRPVNDAIFIANHASGGLAIGDKQELDKATWHKPRLTATSRYICDKLFPKRG